MALSIFCYTIVCPVSLSADLFLFIFLYIAIDTFITYATLIQLYDCVNRENESDFSKKCIDNILVVTLYDLRYLSIN